MMSFDEWMKMVRDVDGCWIRFPPSTCWNYVQYEGKKTYIIEAIFSNYGKIYDGYVTRSCGNRKCVNPLHMMNRIENFWFNVDILSEHDCWEWKSAKGSKEYGTTKWNNNSVKCHRLSYELHYKTKIPDGMEVCHSCDNPPCCNPHHLFIGTRQDNVNDRERKGRNKLPHSLGEEHGQHKLTKKDVFQIRNLYSSGDYSYRSLSEKYGVSFGEIRKVVKREVWGWFS